MFSVPVALQAGLNTTAVYLDAGVCLHVSLCAFVVAGGRLHVRTWMCVYMCVLLIEKFCQITRTAETDNAISSSLQTNPHVAKPSHATLCSECYLNKIW